MDLILIEGVPGSGKSTLAEMLCDWAIANGVSASWYLEEARDHPVHPHNGKRAAACAEIYLDQWQQFVSANSNLDHLFIVEGSLFQSSVRYLMESGNEELIAQYFSDCQDILSPANPKLIYLRPAQIEPHIDWVMNHRGEEWSSKVSGYLEKTEYCSSHNLSGTEGMRHFWSDYAYLCDSLVSSAHIPTQVIEFDLGCFESHFKESVAHIVEATEA